MLDRASLTPVTYYGVRCVNDYILDDQVKFSEKGFGRLLALEEAMGSRSPYRDIARLWQIIARKQVEGQG
jgi:S-adenosylmethionine-dependent methyltransferase